MISLDINKNVTIGSCETTFKDSFGNHKKSFNYLKHKNETELSKEFWEIKKRDGTPKLHGKLSYFPLTTQTVSAAFYV